MFAQSRSLAPRVARSRASGLLLLTILAASANAAETAAKPLPTGGHASVQFVSAWDNDGDDKVPRAEYDAVRTERFAKADSDGNRALSLDEYINEYSTRLEPQFADERQASLKQTHTRFGALDRDKDDFISRTEYDASGAKAFQHLDHDKDGRITEQDPKDPPREGRRSVIGMPTTHNRAGLIEIYDTDGDGTVTKEQYDAQRGSAFTATDTNADGKLDQTEYVNEFVARLDEQIKLRRQAQLKQGGVRFKAIDADKNGAIGRDEYFAMSAHMFVRADTNKDGVLSKDDPAPPRRERRDDERAAANEAGTT